MHAFHESLSAIRGYNPSFDPLCAYLEDVPRKIMWSSFFDHAFDFSMVLDESKELSVVAYYLEEVPFEEFCGDIVMGSDTPNIAHIEPMCTEPPELISISSPLLPTTPSHVQAFHKSSDDIRGYYPSFDPYYAYLEDVPRKIMWSTFFDRAFDFSMAFDAFKRPLT